MRDRITAMPTTGIVTATAIGLSVSFAGVATASAAAGTAASARVPAAATSAAWRTSSPPARQAAYPDTRQPSHPMPAAFSRRTVGGPRLASRLIVVNYPAHHVARLPWVPASAYVIANAGNGQVLAAKDAHGEYPPASTLKVLTAITMLPRLRPDATIRATRRAASVEPNIVGIIAGHRYKVADLFRALLMISANDAAVALVQGAGSFSHGMALLNAEARHLQAYDVLARQPNGLPAHGQVVSAYDLALIARRALAIPAFLKYDSTLQATFPVTRKNRVPMVNQDYLLTQYPGGIGGKIGWTTRAGATFIGLARRHGVTLIVTILHATPLTEINSAEKLLNWGFAMNGRVRPVGVLVPALTAPRLAAKAKHGAPAIPSALAGSHATGAGQIAAGTGIAAGLGLAAAGGLVLARRRTSAKARHASHGTRQAR